MRDVVDAGSLLELRPLHAPNIVVGLAHLDGRSVGVVANQPFSRAGALDISASQKAARFVQWCDAFNLPVVTFVDTPGFEPGKDLEWRGMIRHGAQLVHSYAAATVPRLCVVLRKAYGGAYIVMDSKQLGNDYCLAWPGAQIAVMGGSGAVQVLHGKALAAIDDPETRRRGARAPADGVRRTLQPPVCRGRAWVRRRGDRPPRYPPRALGRTRSLLAQARRCPQTPALEFAALISPPASCVRAWLPSAGERG